ncbi:hypothetical protein GWK36_14140 [Caldichromatium japonicum]|uniref:MotA/TolQ/ExbB proton channel domain-containing protein n=1 Tax=Caldichromatium japonicum TaxID=2699430 RepID=A0A6G7VGA3_9GAMM|nr:hypothetical protein [Caldichromatium japonicum]QIK38940.1 hypothetical protein GWK36_14140 [Caldichromatium japonicum]
MFESIADLLLFILHHLDANQITGLFALTMGALFTLALIASLMQRAPTLQRTAPSLLTTLGILGTFLGIAIGLLDFDPSRIESSIPLLLEGLKLAFSTSIVGIVLAIVLRLTQILGDAQARPTLAQDTPAFDLKDPVALLKLQIQLTDAQLTASRALNDQLAQLEGRLLDTLETQHEVQLAAFNDFAAKISELGSRQLIAALESVIRTFNDRLSAQFGENFRHLDVAIGRLLEWQERYRVHLETLGGQLDLAIAGIEHTQTSLQALTQQAGQITAHVQDQQTTLQALKRETLELESVLGAVAELRERAKDTFPAIDQRLKAMLDAIEGAVLSGLEAQQRIGRLGTTGVPLGGTRMELRGVPA